MRLWSCQWLIDWLLRILLGLPAPMVLVAWVLFLEFSIVTWWPWNQSTRPHQGAVRQGVGWLSSVITCWSWYYSYHLISILCVLLLVAEILHHQGCMKCTIYRTSIRSMKKRDKLPVNLCCMSISKVSMDMPGFIQEASCYSIRKFPVVRHNLRYLQHC